MRPTLAERAAVPRHRPGPATSDPTRDADRCRGELCRARESGRGDSGSSAQYLPGSRGSHGPGRMASACLRCRELALGCAHLPAATRVPPGHPSLHHSTAPSRRPQIRDAFSVHVVMNQSSASCPDVSSCDHSACGTRRTERPCLYPSRDLAERTLAARKAERLPGCARSSTLG